MRRRAVWGEGVMVGGLAHRCFWLVDVKWLRECLIGEYNEVHCEARGMF